jgi:phage tail tape-measure protein
MADKPNARKNKAKAAPTRPATPRKKATKSKSPATAAHYYVTTPHLAAVISREKSAATTGHFASFEEARAAAIDALVLAIEEAEAQLLSLKRSSAPK